MSVLSDQVYFFYILLAEAVQLLVSSLADDSSVVREASMASLRDIASLYVLFISFYFVHKTCNYEYREIFDTELLCDFFFFFLFRNPLLVLDCCYAVSRGGRRVMFCLLVFCFLLLVG